MSRSSSSGSSASSWWGGGGLSRARGSWLEEGEKAVTRIRGGGGNSARHRHQKVVAELEAADGWKRLVQAATQQCTVQFLVESNAGGHDVGSRWRREINVSNHLEPQWKEARFQIPEFFKRPMPISNSSHFYNLNQHLKTGTFIPRLTFSKKPIQTMNAQEW